MPADSRFHDADVVWALLSCSWRFHADNRSWARLRRAGPDDARNANAVLPSDARQIAWPPLSLEEAAEALRQAEIALGRYIDDQVEVAAVLAVAQQARSARARVGCGEALHGQDPEDAEALGSMWHHG